jgi:four helix bundle protein
MSSYKHASIEGLRIYQSSRNLEDQIYELVRKLPPEEFYRLGNDLRRSSAAISHYISEGHKRYSYSLKLEALHLARVEADRLQQLLADYSRRGFGTSETLQEDCKAVTKQAWGLIKYYRRRQSQRQAAARVRAADALVAARSL